MSGDFLDSNVFLYVFAVDDPVRRSVAGEVVRSARAEGSASISFQVVQEVLNGILRRVDSATAHEDARRFLEDFLAPLWRVMPSQQLYEEALRFQARYQYHFYDSLIIAAALAAGCTRLLSEDLQDGQRIEGLTIVNPFAEA